MKTFLFIISLFFFSFNIHSQTLTGTQLLDKALAYHDPNNNWSTFNGELHITMETPNNSNRESVIKINIPQEYFYVKASRDTLTIEYTIIKDDCEIALNGNSNLDEATLKENKLSCKRANMYKNYYTYLYGLPMKLKDHGTHIQEKVERKTFKGKDYLVLKVMYDEAVGSDVWYFYFNQKPMSWKFISFFTLIRILKKKQMGSIFYCREKKSLMV